ncbi:hypothetical protein Z517_05080 [Fonsecaea pedrosoi CBS 271.37]|uniref:Uncharacterized protein n=1 Tax=Fonsecaea pedrosoi CBS 271.37 TaxID=1442368 RepID=A0A0D2GM94_9EURO|nr:uncharacterized protein Z517_05080 [Fonsecaea pedrosoi CBS 271.37]KIW82053.1 hypothetical protein Z517_05080 [Fonsecaea pedrosoi CBS 271.37]
MSNFTFPDIPTLLEPYIPPALQAYFTRQNLQAVVRVIVGISTYILFRPHLESLFRKVTGTPDRREEEARVRVEYLRQQQEAVAAVAGGQGKSVGIVGKDGKIYQVVPPQRGQQQQQAAAGGGKNEKGGRRKGGKGKA